MTPRPELSARRTAVVLALTLFVSYAYFYTAGGWNQNSRFALVRAILEERTLQIDSYKEHTGDRALWNGHFYSDKAPGQSLLAVAPVAIARVGSRAMGVEPRSMREVIWTSYVATVSTAALLTIAAALGVYWLSLVWGASRRAAVLATLAYGLASPAWSYATLFIGHGVTAGTLMLAFLCALALPVSRRGPLLAWVSGLLCGFAVLSEFPAAVPVALIVVFAGVGLYTRRKDDAPRLLGYVIGGGALVALLLMVYNASAFDSPFRLGYGSEDNSEGVAMLERGLFGITRPSLHVIYEVLIGPYRGLLPLAPAFFMAPLGLAWLARARDRRWPILIAAAIALAYILLNVSYHFWEGGWFVGPRHLLPGLPFLALGLAPVWDHGRALGRASLLAAVLWGIGINLVVVSTTPQPPSNVMSPVSELMWPAFTEGDLSLNHQSYVDFGADPDRMRHNPDGHAAWNLGELIGLRGLVSLVPLLLVWAIAARWLL
jgi:hypothetical protein